MKGSLTVESPADEIVQRIILCTGIVLVSYHINISDLSATAKLKAVV